MAEPAPAVPWYKSTWARWTCAVVVPTALAVICPLLPPAAQPFCHAAKAVVQTLPAAPPAPSSPAQGDGACAPGTPPRALPNFCRCEAGRWVDYFDGGACGP